jgi:DNA polymerase-4
MHTPRAVIREISMEAFHEGLQPGMPTDLARLICPGLRIIPPDSSLTQAAHRELQHHISSFAPAWESIRPGSLFLDLTGTTRLFGPPLDTATRISRELAHRQGWPSTIGLAGNKLVSQLAATTLMKPPQVLSIHSGCEQPFLAPLPTMLLPGLHRAHTPRILQRLEDLNLLTLGAIASVSLAHLRVVLGTPANLLHDWALGIDPSPVHPPIAQPMIECSIHLDPDEVDDRLLFGRLYRLSEQICATLRQRQRMCRHISLTVRHSDHVEQTVHETLLHGTYWEIDLQPVLTDLFYRCFRRRVRLTRLTLQVSRLELPARQLSLFDQSESVVLSRSHRLSLALDQVRAKFGEQALSWGRTLTRTIHDGSSRNREVARRDRRVKPGGKETYSKQYVDRPSGEPAC